MSDIGDDEWREMMKYVSAKIFVPGSGQGVCAICGEGMKCEGFSDDEKTICWDACESCKYEMSNERYRDKLKGV